MYVAFPKERYRGIFTSQNINWFIEIMTKRHGKKQNGKIRSKTSLPPLKDAEYRDRSASLPLGKHRKNKNKLRKSTKGNSLYEDNVTKVVNTPKKLRKKSEDVIDNSLIKSFSGLSLNKQQKQQQKVPKYIGEIGGKRNFSKSTSSYFNKETLKSLEDVVKLIIIGRAKNIIVMAGAGISTGSGIPDFRTPGTGLYDNLKKYNIPYPTAIFDLEFFHRDPKPFFELAKDLYPNTKYHPCPAHYFVRMLHEKGLLLRMYTQNIDGLEKLAGIPAEKLVESHGTFSTATCVKCMKKHNGNEIKKKVLKGIIPRCQMTNLCFGIVKPDIVFFGEDLPKRFYYYLKDFPSCDLLIIMGTSLEVEPFAGLTESVRSSVPRVLLNREKVGPFASKKLKDKDVAITGDLKDIIKRFVTELDWNSQFDDMVKLANKARSEINDSEGETSSADSGFSSAAGSQKVEDRNQVQNPTTNTKRNFHSKPPIPIPRTRAISSYKHNSNLIKSKSNSTVSYYDFIRKKTKENEAPPYTIQVRTFGEVPLIHYTKTVKKSKCNMSSESSSCYSSSDEYESDSDTSN